METSHIDLAILNYAANNICLDADRGEASTFIYCFDSIATQIAVLLEKLGFTTEIKEHNGYVIKSIEGTMVKPLLSKLKIVLLMITNRFKNNSIK